MPKPGSQAQKRIPGWWKRQEVITKFLIAGLSAITVILIVAVVLVAAFGVGNGNPVASASSTTLGSVAQTDTTATTAATETTTATTAATETTTATTAATASSTTTATATADTADHVADYRAQYPSTESFTNSSWATLDKAPGSHLGAAVDVIGRVTGDPAIDSNTGYLAWHISVPIAGGKELQALCRTNINLDRNLLPAGGWVEVRGIAVGPQASTASSGVALYVETVKRATKPATITP